ncbi:unnamed protein product, partial [Symbiodinium microadriaticum]
DLFETYQDDAEEGTAYMADEGEQDDWVYHGDEGPVDEEYDDTDLVAQTADASLRDVELDVFTSFLCSEGFDENDRESLAFMADIVQSETVAFMARSKAKGKGKPVSAKGGSFMRLNSEARARPVAAKDTGRATENAQAAANYVSLGRDSETEPAAYMGFFDKGDFEESDEELVDDFASQGAPSTEWDTIEYPEGSDQLFRFGMHKGSTTFCLDCCTVIEEVPQKLFKQNKGLSDQVLNSPLKVQNLTRRQLEEYTFTKFEAGDVVKRFFKHMDNYLMKADQ